MGRSSFRRKSIATSPDGAISALQNEALEFSIAEIKTFSGADSMARAEGMKQRYGPVIRVNL